jgi:hypothetical protein
MMLTLRHATLTSEGTGTKHRPGIPSLRPRRMTDEDNVFTLVMLRFHAPTER